MIIRTIKLALLIGLTYMGACVYTGVQNGLMYLSEMFKMPNWSFFSVSVLGKAQEKGSSK